MLPVSQAVQASKATIARAATANDNTAGDGFAALLQGLHNPPAATDDAQAASRANASGTSGSSTPAANAAGDGSASGGAPAAANGTPNSPADSAAGNPSSDSAATASAATASTAASAGRVRASGSDGSGNGNDPNGTPRLRRALVSLAADGSAAAAAAAAAQLAQTLQAAPGPAAGKGGSAGAGGGDALAGSTGRSASSRLAAWGDRQVAQGTNATTTPDAGTSDAGSFTLAADSAQDDGQASLSSRLAGELRADKGPLSAASDATSGSSGTSTLSAGLSALLSRQGGELASQLQAALSGAQPGLGVAATALRGSEGAAADGSLLYAQLMPGAASGMAAEAASASAEPATLAIAPALGDERWSAALGQQALFMARNEVSSARLTVSPPDLGPIQITLDMNHDQANAVFVSPHDAVRQAIEASLPQLRDMFSAAGLQLSSAQVQADAGGMAWTAQQGSQGQGSGSSAGGTRTSVASTDAGPAASAAPVRVTRGLLDTFA